jgi:hypothetical protein
VTVNVAAVSAGRRFLVDVDPLGRDALLTQGVDLPIELLFGGRYPCVPDIQGLTVPKVRFIRPWWDVVLGLLLERKYMACRRARSLPW